MTLPTSSPLTRRGTQPKSGSFSVRFLAEERDGAAGCRYGLVMLRVALKWGGSEIEK
jgi:hypothetical protein